MTLPSDIALTPIPVDALAVSSDVNNSFSTVQTALNALIDYVAALSSTSGATVATSISGLGAPANGRIGLLNISSLADEITVIYDTAWPHWVSGSQTLVFQGTSGLNSNNTASTWAGLGSTASIPYKPFLDAGLGLQIRLVGLLGHGSGTDDVGLRLTPYAASGTAGTPSTDAAIISSSGSLTMQDSGWVAAPAVTSNTYVVVTPTGRGSANNTYQMGGLSVLYRWVG